MLKMIEMIRSGPVAGAWHPVGWKGEASDAEADALIRMGKAKEVARPAEAAPAVASKPKGKASE